MPYKEEYAKFSVINNILNEDYLKNFISVAKPTNNEEVFVNICSNIPLINEKFMYSIVIDGSKINLDLKFSNLNNEESVISILNIAQLTFNLNKFENFSKKSFPDPLSYYKSYESISEKLILPIENIIDNDSETCSEFFRKTIFDFFASNYNPSFKKYSSEQYKPLSYLSTFKNILLSNTSEVIVDTKDKSFSKIRLSDFKSNETCLDTITKQEENLSIKYYITDLLGMHKYFAKNDVNTEVSNLTMLFVEKIMLFNFIENIVKLSLEVWGLDPQKFFDINLFIIDGPLANFGDTYWLGSKMKSFIKSLGYNISLIGIEKTGLVVNLLDKILRKEQEIGLARTLIKIDDEFYYKYLNNNIDSDRISYFGERYIYNDKKNNSFVFNYLNLKNDIPLITNKNVIDDHDLLKITSIFDNFSSTKYKNGLSLISIANEHASISNSHASSKLLKEYISKELNL